LSKTTDNEKTDKLSVIEWKVLHSLADKALKGLSLADIPSGGHPIDFQCEVSAVLTKQRNGDVAASFDETAAMRSWLVSWAMAQRDPAKSLSEILAFSRQKPEKSLTLEAMLSTTLSEAKARYHEETPRVPKAGNSQVVGCIRKV
jgi:hypothetical protein